MHWCKVLGSRFGIFAAVVLPHGSPTAVFLLDVMGREGNGIDLGGCQRDRGAKMTLIRV